VTAPGTPPGSPGPGTRQDRRAVLPVVCAALLLVLGGPAALLVSVALGFASDGCSGGDDALICRSSVQLLVFSLPFAGLVVGMALCVTGIVTARRGGPPARWALAGWAAFLAMLLTALSLARAF
jgi:hypothetical protein